MDRHKCAQKAKHDFWSRRVSAHQGGKQSRGSVGSFVDDRGRGIILGAVRNQLARKEVWSI